MLPTTSGIQRAICSGLARLVISAYAKLGANVSVPRYLCKVSSQMVAFLMKLIVAMNTAGIRKQMGAMTNPISPMSWYSGSHDTATSCAPSAHSPSRTMAAQFAARLPCVTITPLGSAVLPDVNWRKATSSSRTSAAAGSAPASFANSAVVSTFSMLGIRPTADHSTLATRSVVTRTRGVATLRMLTRASMNASSLPSETGG